MIGRVSTFAIYHIAYHPEFAVDVPYTVSIVALDEGSHLLTYIAGCRFDEVRCNIQVGVFWEDVDETITLPKFRPLLCDQA